MLSLMFCGAGCEKKSDYVEPAPVHQRKIAPIKSLGKTATLTLYEGLPHWLDEEKDHNLELAAKKTVRFHGFSFYETPLTVVPADLEKLRSLFTGEDTFYIYSHRRCLFHPDYCFVWKEETVTYEVLLCLTCQQAKFFSSDNQEQANLQKHGYEEFTHLLKKYVSQRPKTRNRR